jgi:hypothetical protein
MSAVVFDTSSSPFKALQIEVHTFMSGGTQAWSPRTVIDGAFSAETGSITDVSVMPGCEFTDPCTSSCTNARLFGQSSSSACSFSSSVLRIAGG